MTELREHVPFSVAAVAMGLIAAGGICILGFANGGGEYGDHGDNAAGGDGTARLFFHLFHSTHMLFSAAATTAMFCRYEKRIVKAVIVGLVGAVGVCGISDIVFPQLSLLLMGVEAPWHICVYEHPGLALPFAFAGVGMGIAAAGGVVRSTIITHALHVVASTMASIFYMIGPLGLVAWIHDLGRVFILVVFAVMVPCCLSDIVFPTLMSKPARGRFDLEPHQH